MWWILIAYPLAFAACIYTGYQCRIRIRHRFKSLGAAIACGGAFGLVSSAMLLLWASYDYFMDELLRLGSSARMVAIGGMLAACLSAAGWKERGNVERRRMNRPH